MVDPVQSIRIATTLAERFRVLVASANRGFGELGIADLELKIGEAQQIYPEVWRHLEDARGVLVERGVDVSAFDELRAGELVKLGVTDVDVTQQVNYAALIGGRLRYQTVKTATFNIAGYHRAVAACRALMAAMPEIDWQALAKAEDKEIAAAGSLQAGKYVAIGKWLAIAGVLGAVGVGAYELLSRGGDHDDRTTTLTREQDVAQLRVKVEARQDAIAAARAAYEETCDPKQRDQLAKLLHDDSQLSAAQQVLTAPCKPQPPRCGEGRDAAQTRIIAQFAIDPGATEDYDWRCAGGFFVNHQPGLAVALTGKTKAGTKISVRGVVSRDGASDLVAPAVWPHEVTAIDTGDLDGDGSDEIVIVYPQGVAVSRVRDGKLVDVASPPVLAMDPVAHACTGSVQLDDDPEKPQASRLMIDVDDGARGAGCPVPGRHAYVLQGDKLVDAAPPE